MLCSNCGQPVSDSNERFTYTVSRVHVGAKFVQDSDGQAHHERYAATDWPCCSLTCLKQFVASQVTPEPKLE